MNFASYALRRDLGLNPCILGTETTVKQEAKIIMYLSIRVIYVDVNNFSYMGNLVKIKYNY